MDSGVQSILSRMALAADPAEVAELRPQLLAAIDRRLQELGTDDHDHCLSCGYTLTLGAEDICLCCAGICPCGRQWPPYNEFFRCEVQARLAWFAHEAAMYQARGSKIPFETHRFPGDPAPPPPALDPNAGLFEQFRQVNLEEYAGRFTRLTEIGPGHWRGRCPLHQEKTGSFSVYQKEGSWSWHCYGACGMGGDIVTLELELHRLGKV